MKKNKSLFFLVLAFMCNAAFGSNEDVKIQTPEKPSWGVWIDFLYWQPSQQGLEFAISKTNSPLFQPTKMKFREPDFDWSPGFQLGLSKDFLDSGLTTLLNWTYYSNTSCKKISSHNTGTFIEQLWVPFQFGIDTTQSSERWHLFYNTVDLLVGTNFMMSKRFNLESYFGLRGLFADQNLTARYVDF